MQIGCGVRVMRVKARTYLYFWHYETVNGGRKHVLRYVGPAKDSASRREAISAMEEYVHKAISEARRQLQSGVAQAMAATR